MAALLPVFLTRYLLHYKNSVSGNQEGTLSRQFFDALQQWSEKTGFPEDDLRLYILDRVGPGSDWSDVEMELATIESRVEELVHSVGISEKFLIVALIQAIDKEFVLQLADLAQGE